MFSYTQQKHAIDIGMFQLVINKPHMIPFSIGIHEPRASSCNTESADLITIILSQNWSQGSIRIGQIQNKFAFRVLFRHTIFVLVRISNKISF